MSFAITFKISRGDTPIAEKTIEQSVIKIGKLSSSHLRLDGDDKISRMHAVIEAQEDGTVCIIDLGSHCGTFVNEQKVNKAYLRPGDKIRLGNTTVVTEWPVEPNEEAKELDVETAPTSELLRYHTLLMAIAGVHGFEKISSMGPSGFKAIEAWVEGTDDKKSNLPEAAGRILALLPARTMDTLRRVEAELDKRLPIPGTKRDLTSLKQRIAGLGK